MRTKYLDLLSSVAFSVWMILVTAHSIARNERAWPWVYGVVAILSIVVLILALAGRWN